MQQGARFLAYGGTAVIVLTMAQVHGAEIGGYDFVSSSRLVWTLAYIALLSIAAFAVGLPDTQLKLRQALAAALVSTGVAALGISVLQLLAGSALLPRFVTFVSAGFLIPWYAICADVAANQRHRQQDRDRVAIVGNQEEIQALSLDLAATPERQASIVCALSVDSVDIDGEDGTPLIDAADQAKASVLVIDVVAQSRSSIVAQAAVLHERGVRIRTLSLFYEEWLGKLPLSELERVSLMFDIGEVHRTLYGRQKRVIDVAIGLVGLAALLSITPFVLLGNAVGNRGKLIFRQERVGKNSKIFTILKFRTMKSQSDNTSWTLADDERITPFGGFLRRTHLDELPQVWNILKGDLSIVGPRPEQPSYVDELTASVPFYGMRHLVRPGLSGWAQVKYAYGATAVDAMEKLQYEFFYLRHQGVVLDLRIIVRTIRHVVSRAGR